MTALPEIPDVTPRWGNFVLRGAGRLALRVLRWRIVGSIPAERRLVVIAAPHTSNWDFVVGLAAMLALGIRVHWLGKHTIFSGLFGFVLRWLGGIPVNRDVPGGVIEHVVSLVHRAPAIIIGLSPEGTRARVERWKTGFLRIASAADIPVLPVGLDYSRRCVRLLPLFRPTGDTEADVAALHSLFSPSMARHPQQFS